MVETAITISLFMMLVLALFEVALLVFQWGRTVEATRVGLRQLVVNTPAAAVSALDCNVGGSVSFTCADGNCGAAFDAMQGLSPLLQPDNVQVTFACSGAGYSARPDAMPIYQVDVRVQGVETALVIPGMVGIPAVVTMPAFNSSRVSEDLHTP